MLEFDEEKTEQSFLFGIERMYIKLFLFSLCSLSVRITCRFQFMMFIAI